MSALKICNNKILWVICSELMSLWAGSNKKNMNMVCIIIMGPLDVLRDSGFSLTLFDLSITLRKLTNCSKQRQRFAMHRSGVQRTMDVKTGGKNR